MHADFEHNSPLAGGPHITAVGSHAGSRHSEQSRIFAWFHRYAKDAVDSASRFVVHIAYLIDIDLIGASLRQQGLVHIKFVLASLIERLFPELVEIGRTFCLGHDFLRREGRRAHSVVFLSVDRGDDLQSVESRCRHLARPFHGAVFQHHPYFLHLGIHIGSRLIVDADVFQQRPRFPYLDSKLSFLTHLVIPVVMVGIDVDDNVVAPYLSEQRHRQPYEEQQKSSFHHDSSYFSPILVILITSCLTTSRVEVSVANTEFNPWASCAGSPV